jgi:hypothetical protein
MAKAAKANPSPARRIEYVPLSKVVPALRNPKLHAEADLDKSVGRFGYTEPVLLDERTGRLVAGHGRIDSLKRLKEKGGEPPEGVQVQGKEWAIPVTRGWASRNDSEAEAYLLASNQLTIAGGWDEEKLEEMLRDLAATQSLDGAGWDEKELEKLLAESAGDGLYTGKVEAPIYKPTGEKPKVSELYDTERLRLLTREIDEATDITEEERVFLRMAATRHLTFDYQNIAEFYAHASAPLQRLMEQSALVIIDFKQAIELGFVKMAEALAEAAGENEDGAA